MEAFAFTKEPESIKTPQQSMAEVSCQRAGQENIQVVLGHVPCSQGTVDYSKQRRFPRCPFYILVILALVIVELT